jgi:AraC-like DNA-binding protein
MADYYKEKELPQLLEYGIEFFSLKHNSSGTVTRAHIHPAIEFIYLTKGAYEIGIEGAYVEAFPGDLLLFRSNAIHTLRNIGACEGEYYVLKIDPSLLFQIFIGKDNGKFITPFIRKKKEDISHFPASVIPNESKLILDAMILESEKADGFFYAVERAHAASLLISLLRYLIKPEITSDINGEISEKSVALILESVQYINENYASDITPADCAANIHLSYSYFAKLFRAVIGKTFKEYLTGVRLAKAHNILIATDIPITDVAISCGYTNLSYFISEYKKVYGRTPRDTRKELLGK